MGSYIVLPSESVIEKTLDSFKARGVSAYFVQNKIETLEKLKSLIPAGVEVMTASSTTLEEIGFIDLLKSKAHPWKNLKDGVLAEKDPAKQAELRKKNTLSDYFIGSVHAITQEGQTLTASGSGSQIPSYAFSSNNVIWVAGAQKIVPRLEDGLRRIREYALPREDSRMKHLGFQGSTIGKILIFEREIMPRRKIYLILVNEVLGF